MTRFIPMRSADVCDDLRDVLPGGEIAFDDQPEFFRVLAKSRPALQAYLEAARALANGMLSPRDRNRIALAVSEINGSGYDLSVQARAAKTAGLADHDVELARRAAATDPRICTLLRFVQALVLQRGEIADGDLEALRHAGFSEAETVEIVANVALNVFSNYLNLAARTEVELLPSTCRRAG